MWFVVCGFVVTGLWKAQVLLRVVFRTPHRMFKVVLSSAFDLSLLL